MDNNAVGRPPSQTYFPALDGIRAFAFILVFLHHYCALPWGWAGVDIFFVLSGFLITGILFDTQHHPHRVRNFYVRRTLRIFPLYYGLIAVLILLYPVFQWRWNWTWLLWPLYLGNFARFIHPIVIPSMLQMMADARPLSRTHPQVMLAIGHFWSLCVEEQFYLVWPWVVFWVKDRKPLLYVCLGSVVLCPLMRVAGSQFLPHWMIAQEVLYRATPFRIDALLLGGLLALVQRGEHARRMLTVARIVFAAISAAVLVWLALSPAARHGGTGYVYPPWAWTWGLTFVDLWSASLIVQALQSASIVFRIFDQSWMRWLGRISYGLYVFHDIPHTLIYEGRPDANRELGRSYRGDRLRSDRTCGMGEPSLVRDAISFA